MKFSPVSTACDAKSLLDRNLPVLAIDLGFSGKRATCGACCHPADARFDHPAVYADLLSSVTKWLNNTDQREAVLIIEAPLSGGFDAGGNPVARGEFERFHSQTRQSSPRHWNVMAGASMALAAVHFCHEILRRITSDFTVHLIEGFASRYTTDPDRKPGHQDIAQELLALWQNGHHFTPFDPGIRLVSIPQILGYGDVAPGVLRVGDGFAKG